MRNDEACRDYYETARTKFQEMRTSGAAVSVHDPDDESYAQWSRKVPKRLQGRVTDQFLTDTPVTDLYEMTNYTYWLLACIYFPIRDRVIANLHERFEDKNKAIMDGIAALQFDIQECQQLMQCLQLRNSRPCTATSVSMLDNVVYSSS